MSSSTRPLRRNLARLACVLGALAVALVALELGARAFDPFGISYYRDNNRYFNEAIELPPEAGRPDGRLFQNRPGLELEFTTFRLRTNALGLRSSATADGVTADRSGASAGKRRLLFLGDSVTLGWGVDDEHTWVRRVERAGHGPAGEPLECLNAGHLQYNTIQESDWLHTFGPHLSPDGVILTFVVNDLDDAWAIYQEWQTLLAEAALAGAASRPGPWTRLRGWFHSVEGLVRLARERRAAKTQADRRLERVEDVPHYAEAWPLARAALERMRAFCAERAVPLVVLDHSTPAIPALEAWCAETGTPCYDFRFDDAEWARDIRNSLADAHANELGNQLLAAKALAALADAGLLVEAPR